MFSRLNAIDQTSKMTGKLSYSMRSVKWRWRVARFSGPGLGGAVGLSVRESAISSGVGNTHLPHHKQLVQTVYLAILLLQNAKRHGAQRQLAAFEVDVAQRLHFARRALVVSRRLVRPDSQTSILFGIMCTI